MGKEDETGAEGNAMNIGLLFEDDVTGIVTVERGVVDNNGWYTLQGVKVSHPTKGIYINNNKKVVLK